MILTYTYRVYENGANTAAYPYLESDRAPFDVKRAAEVDPESLPVYQWVMEAATKLTESRDDRQVGMLEISGILSDGEETEASVPIAEFRRQGFGEPVRLDNVIQWRSTEWNEAVALLEEADEGSDLQ